jgi:hypothetical protein
MTKFKPAKVKPALTQYVTELDRLDITLDQLFPLDNVDPTDSPINAKETQEKLFSLGVVIPYADAFSYRGNAILLVGQPEIGKTPIAEGFQTNHANNSVVYATDHSMIYKPRRNAKPVVYLDDVNSTEHPFFVPFLFPNEPGMMITEEVPLRFIFHLKKAQNLLIQEGNLAEAVDYMMFYMKDGKRAPSENHDLMDLFKEVKCYDLFKRLGYGGCTNKIFGSDCRVSPEARNDLYSTIEYMRRFLDCDIKRQ